MTDQMKKCCFRIGSVCMLMYFCGCSHKYYSIRAENQRKEELEAVEISFIDSEFNFRFGVLGNGISAGYGPCDPKTIPQKVKFTWEQEGVKHEQEVLIPQSIRKKIKGKAEDLYFQFGDDGKIEVYVKIRNPMDLTNPEFFPQKFGKKQRVTQPEVEIKGGTTQSE